VKDVKIGLLRGIWISPAARAPLVGLAEVRAVPGRGLEGDRYFFARGSFSRWPGTGRAVSLIAEETLEAVCAEHGFDLRGGRSRRNLVTSGIGLTDLQERTFRIGTAVLRGVRSCAPCHYLERLTEAGVFDALKGRGGLRADVIEEGILHIGDAIELLGGF
jgi:MOSC domain-containing protein YiiM